MPSPDYEQISDLASHYIWLLAKTIPKTMLYKFHSIFMRTLLTKCLSNNK